jgi:hypothetical protein
MFFFRSCGSSKDSTSYQHTFSSSIPLLLHFVFKVYKFLSNCLLRNVIYPNLTHFLVRANLPKMTSPYKTPSILFYFSLTLHLKYINCFQIIKLRTMKLTKRFFFNMVDLLLICALCDQEMFIACLLCTWPFCEDHTHSICIEHDINVADRHIARRYVDLEVRLAHVVMVIKYEVVLLCFQSPTSFCF